MERKEFIKESCERSEHFNEPIKRVKLHAFKEEGVKAKAKQNNNIVETRMKRDVLGSCLFLALKNKIDMVEVLKYPPTPVPLSLCHADGNMMKTSKSALLTYLESKVTTILPNDVQTTIIDGMFYLYLLFDLPLTFGGVAKQLLRHICFSDGGHLHFICDQHIFPSVKECERNTRMGGDSHPLYTISGPNQKRPNNCRDAL